MLRREKANQSACKISVNYLLWKWSSTIPDPQPTENSPYILTEETILKFPEIHAIHKPTSVVPYQTNPIRSQWRSKSHIQQFPFPLRLTPRAASTRKISIIWYNVPYYSTNKWITSILLVMDICIFFSHCNEICSLSWILSCKIFPCL